ncbi:hypothetical protein DID88_010018 [Monilinia fructigena]|uniref:Uncharacterized protein n=1 Tax=Monilinia fructigena TaxID=38457 RepID=A0A395IKA4_9HELO|nr:hypothetical protein DID88_010018 [Monilinia fructigena]
MDESTPGDLKETGAGNGDFSQTDIIDYAIFKDINGKVIDPPTASRSSRKKRKAQVDGVDHAHDVNQDEKSSDEEYKHKVAYAMKKNKKNLDLDEVNARLNEYPSLDETPSEKVRPETKVNANNLFRNGMTVPSGAAFSNKTISSLGNGKKRPSFSERRVKKPLMLSPTLVNDESVFNWGRAVGGSKNDGHADNGIDGNNENSTNKIPTESEKSARTEAIPSSILEKGIIYFFYRPRVSAANQAQGIEDVARSFFVMRPLPLKSKIEKGPLQDNGDARLLSLPKKTWPKRIQDKFLCFVEKAGLGIKELKEHLSGSSNLPPVTPIAEGIYAISHTDRESHLAYCITYPQISEVQRELGIKEKGSFVCSIKNPKAPGPANATIDNPAKYTKELQENFRNLRWGSLVPEHLNYEGTQMLIICEGKSVDSKKDDNNGPEDEINRLEQEDHTRMEGLKEDDPIFADLSLSAEEYSHMQTTW